MRAFDLELQVRVREHRVASALTRLLEDPEQGVESAQLREHALSVDQSGPPRSGG